MRPKNQERARGHEAPSTVRHMPTQMYFMDLARRCRFLSHNTLDLRVARELRTLGDELEAKAREAQVIADAAVPTSCRPTPPR